jgi:integrase
MAARRSAKHRGVRWINLGTDDAPRWVVRWADPATGRQVQRDAAPFGITNERARERWAIEKAAALRADKARYAIDGVASVRTPVSEAQDKYLATFGNAHTRVAKAKPLANLAEHLTDNAVRSMQDVTSPIIAAWGDHVRRPSSPHAPSTRNFHLAVAGAWLQWSRRRGWLPRVSGDAIRDSLRRERAPREAIKVLQPAEIRQLLDACMRHDEQERTPIAPFVLVVLGSGMRLAECEGLRWEEVDTRAKCIRLGAARAKTKAHRVITLEESPATLAALAALRLRSGSGERVFPRATRNVVETIRRQRLQRFGAPAGWGWHDLRRTHGSLLACSGLLGAGSSFLVARKLGHGVQVAERHYLHAYVDLPKGTTLEQVGGFEAEAREIVRRISLAQKAVAQ